jgi:hypothetical protein
MKIPEPIIEPMTIVVQSYRRRPLTNSEEGVWEVALREAEVAMLGRGSGIALENIYLQESVVRHQHLAIPPRRVSSQPLSIVDPAERYPRHACL